MFSDEKQFNTARDKASVLNIHFQYVFTSEDLSNILSYHSSVSSMPPIIISIEGIEALLTKLDTNKSAGPDQIPSYILKHCAKEVAPILQVIFNQSLYPGQLPSDWLMANIAPAFKKGNQSCPTNYRPISLTSICCKTLEHIIFIQSWSFYRLTMYLLKTNMVLE